MGVIRMAENKKAAQLARLATFKRRQRPSSHLRVSEAAASDRKSRVPRHGALYDGGGSPSQ
jgi:hypothetical protein